MTMTTMEHINVYLCRVPTVNFANDQSHSQLNNFVSKLGSCVQRKSRKVSGFNYTTYNRQYK